MRVRRTFLLLGALLTLLGGFAALALLPADRVAPGPVSGVQGVRFRLGLIPDRNLYDQRLAYRALADYLQSHTHLGRGASTLDAAPPLQIELVTSSNYAGVLKDFADDDVDGAFLGSIVAVLAADRCGAQVLAKSQNLSGQDTYAGVLFVTEKSPISSMADLKGKKLGAVRTTMAGSIYPLFALQNMALAADARPEFLWSGTHDDVIEEVLARRVDAGAVKDLRLDAYEREHPDVKFRRLATGPRAPDNAFVVSRKLPSDLREALVAALLAMQKDPDAQGVLQRLKLRSFQPCTLAEYQPLYDMIDAVGPRWAETGIEGSAPQRPVTASAGGK